MAYTRLLTTGFEGKSSLTDTGGVGTAIGSPTWDGTIKRSGNWALKLNAVGQGLQNVIGASASLSPSKHYYSRAWLYYTGAPAATAEILIGNDQLTTDQWRVRLDTSGNLLIVDGGQTQRGSSVAISSSGWHCVEVWWMISGGILVARLDGTEFCNVTGASLGSNPLTHLKTGIFTGTIGTLVVYWDDVAVNEGTSTLTPSDAPPYGGKVVLTLPSADIARSTLWTGGVGGTTNLFDAVNNTPPIGTATETDLTQIEHAGNAATSTDDYLATVDGYATLGLTVNGIYSRYSGSLSAIVGNSSANAKIAQKIVTRASGTNQITQLQFGLFKSGSPTDNVIVEIQTDSAGAPSGTALASWSYAGSSILGASSIKTETVAGLLSNSTTYWLVISRSGAVDATNYYFTNRSGGLSTNGWANLPNRTAEIPQEYQVWNGTNWVGSSTSQSLAFALVDPNDSGISSVRTVQINGEDIATGSKLLSGVNYVALETNSRDVTDSSGALGTFPSGWWYRGVEELNNAGVPWAYPDCNYVPFVGLSRPETATRVASCCFLGVQIEFVTPIPKTASPASISNTTTAVGVKPILRTIAMRAVGAQTTDPARLAGSVDAGSSANWTTPNNALSDSDTGAAAVLPASTALSELLLNFNGQMGIPEQATIDAVEVQVVWSGTGSSKTVTLYKGGASQGSNSNISSGVWYNPGPSSIWTVNQVNTTITVGFKCSTAVGESISVDYIYARVKWRYDIRTIANRTFTRIRSIAVAPKDSGTVGPSLGSSTAGSSGWTTPNAILSDTDSAATAAVSGISGVGTLLVDVSGILSGLPAGAKGVAISMDFGGHSNSGVVNQDDATLVDSSQVAITGASTQSLIGLGATGNVSLAANVTPDDLKKVKYIQLVAGTGDGFSQTGGVAYDWVKINLSWEQTVWTVVARTVVPASGNTYNKSFTVSIGAPTTAVVRAVTAVRNIVVTSIANTVSMVRSGTFVRAVAVASISNTISAVASRLFTRSVSVTSISSSVAMVRSGTFSRTLALSVANTIAAVKAVTAPRSVAVASIASSTSAARIGTFVRAITVASIANAVSVAKAVTAPRSVSVASISNTTSAVHAGTFSRTVAVASIAVTTAATGIRVTLRSISVATISSATAAVHAGTFSRTVAVSTVTSTITTLRALVAPRSISVASIANTTSAARIGTFIRTVGVASISAVTAATKAVTAPRSISVASIASSTVANRIGTFVRAVAVASISVTTSAAGSKAGSTFNKSYSISIANTISVAKALTTARSVTVASIASSTGAVKALTAVRSIAVATISNTTAAIHGGVFSRVVTVASITSGVVMAKAVTAPRAISVAAISITTVANRIGTFARTITLSNAATTSATGLKGTIRSISVASIANSTVAVRVGTFIRTANPASIANTITATGIKVTARVVSVAAISVTTVAVHAGTFGRTITLSIANTITTAGVKVLPRAVSVVSIANTTAAVRSGTFNRTIAVASIAVTTIASGLKGTIRSISVTAISSTTIANRTGTFIRTFTGNSNTITITTTRTKTYTRSVAVGAISVVTAAVKAATKPRTITVNNGAPTTLANRVQTNLRSIVNASVPMTTTVTISKTSVRSAVVGAIANSIATIFNKGYSRSVSVAAVPVSTTVTLNGIYGRTESFTINHTSAARFTIQAFGASVPIIVLTEGEYTTHFYLNFGGYESIQITDTAGYRAEIVIGQGATV